MGKPTAPGDDPGFEGSWTILPIADTLLEQRSSTATRLGRPFVPEDLDGPILAAEGVTRAALSHTNRFWRLDVSSTETGISHVSTPRPVREEVQRLRDEIARLTRLTREQIARALGVDRRSLSAWVKGETSPGPERLERLRILALVIRDIEASQPGSATEVLLSRFEGVDLLDRIAAGQLRQAHDWRVFQGRSPVHIELRRSTKRRIYQSALDAYLRGELRPLGRAATIRPESDYEQDLAQAERLMSDEPVRRSRRGYQ